MGGASHPEELTAAPDTGRGRARGSGKERVHRDTGRVLDSQDTRRHRKSRRACADCRCQCGRLFRRARSLVRICDGQPGDSRVGLAFCSGLSAVRSARCAGAADGHGSGLLDAGNPSAGATDRVCRGRRVGVGVPVRVWPLGRSRLRATACDAGAVDGECGLVCGVLPQGARLAAGDHCLRTDQVRNLDNHRLVAVLAQHGGCDGQPAVSRRTAC